MSTTRSRRRRIFFAPANARRLLESLEQALGGVGKPEPLKHALAGAWSWRITDEHRLVYVEMDDRVILEARYHY
jgi:toxin YoeB